MPTKILDLLGSIRFWLFTMAATIAILQVYGIIDPQVTKILVIWLTGVGGVGTLDSIAEKLGIGGLLKSLPYTPPLVEPIDDENLG